MNFPELDRAERNRANKQRERDTGDVRSSVEEYAGATTRLRNKIHIYGKHE